VPGRKTNVFNLNLQPGKLKICKMKFVIRIPGLLIISGLLLGNSAYSQKDTSGSPLQFSGYLEAYYLYDFGNPANHTRPGFVYSHNRHNEVNINLGLIKAAYQTEKVRANLSLATGSYMNANYSAEPGVLKNIYEANAGVKISKKKNVWVDAGIFSSHIGFESAIGKDCWTLTRSLLADNSPYFETGAKISYTTDDGQWLLSGLVLNGWQRIQRIDGNNTPAFGHQVTWTPNPKLTLNSSSFIGNDKPDSVRQMRYFHDFYARYQATKKLGFIFGFDAGAEQKAKGSKRYNTWYSPVLIVRYAASSKSFLTARVEYYSDRNGVIISTGTANGFQTFGYSFNYDYQIRENVMWRVEARGLSGKDKIFMQGSKASNANQALVTSLAINF
jgi:Putative beta-barrel porin-2, OmpL-like. bbp2